jgi:hypothetical protein
MTNDNTSIDHFVEEIKNYSDTVSIEPQSNKSHPIYYSIKLNDRIIVYVTPRKSKGDFLIYTNANRDNKIEVIDSESYSSAIKFAQNRIISISNQIKTTS